MRIKMFCNDPPSLYPYLYPMTFVNPNTYMNVHQCSINAQVQNLTNEINRGILTANQIRQNSISIYDLDRLIFPFDPIRDWVEKKVKRINEKYAWAEEL